jgi:hypothetical protein
MVDAPGSTTWDYDNRRRMTQESKVITGSGYLLYSAESVHTRFAANPPHGDNADHFICVKYVSGQWKYDNNIDYYAFTPEEGDILMASINFDTDVITSLQGQDSTQYGIAKGYDSGNLGYVANLWNGGSNSGEFTVTGTSYTLKIPGDHHIRWSPGF